MGRATHCGFTNLGIWSGDKVRVMALKRGIQGFNLCLDPFELFHPASALVTGSYCDDGWIDFDEGQGELLVETAELCGIETDVDEFLSANDDHYPFVIKEETYQMLRTLEYQYYSRDGAYTTLTAPMSHFVDQLRPEVDQLLSSFVEVGATDMESTMRHLLRRDGFKMDQKYYLDQLFRFSEGTKAPIIQQLCHKAHRTVPATLEEYQAIIEPAYDIMLLNLAYTWSRRLLTPSGILGLQFPEETVHMQIGKFIAEEGKKIHAKHTSKD